MTTPREQKRPPVPDHLRATTARVDFDVLVHFGLRELAEELWSRSVAVSDRCRRDARRRVRERFGHASSFGGRLFPLYLVIGLAITGVIAPIGIAGRRRSDFIDTPTHADEIATASAAAAGVGFLVVLLLIGSRVVDRGIVPGAIRIAVLWVAAGVAAGSGWSSGLIATPTLAVVLITTALACASPAWFWLWRRAHPDRATAIDDAPAEAVREQMVVMEAEAESLRAYARSRLEGQDVDRIIADRVEATTLWKIAGDSPEAWPGDAIIAQQTAQWLEKPPGSS